MKGYLSALLGILMIGIALLYLYSTIQMEVDYTNNLPIKFDYYTKATIYSLTYQSVNDTLNPNNLDIEGFLESKNWEDYFKRKFAMSFINKLLANSDFQEELKLKYAKELLKSIDLDDVSPGANSKEELKEKIIKDVLEKSEIRLENDKIYLVFDEDSKYHTSKGPLFKKDDEIKLDTDISSYIEDIVDSIEIECDENNCYIEVTKDTKHCISVKDQKVPLLKKGTKVPIGTNIKKFYDVMKRVYDKLKPIEKHAIYWRTVENGFGWRFIKNFNSMDEKEDSKTFEYLNEFEKVFDEKRKLNEFEENLRKYVENLIEDDNRIKLIDIKIYVQDIPYSIEKVKCYLTNSSTDNNPYIFRYDGKNYICFDLQEDNQYYTHLTSTSTKYISKIELYFNFHDSSGSEIYDKDYVIDFDLKEPNIDVKSNPVYAGIGKEYYSSYLGYKEKSALCGDDSCGNYYSYLVGKNVKSEYPNGNGKIYDYASCRVRNPCCSKDAHGHCRPCCVGCGTCHSYVWIKKTVLGDDILGYYYSTHIDKRVNIPNNIKNEVQKIEKSIKYSLLNLKSSKGYIGFELEDGKFDIKYLK